MVCRIYIHCSKMFFAILIRCVMVSSDIAFPTVAFYHSLKIKMQLLLLFLQVKQTVQKNFQQYISVYIGKT